MVGIGRSAGVYIGIVIRVRVCVRASADIIVVKGLLSTVDITYRLITAIDIVVSVYIGVRRCASRSVDIVVVIGIRAGAIHRRRRCVNIVVVIGIGRCDCAVTGRGIICIYSCGLLSHSNTWDRKQSCNNARYYNFFHSIRSRVGQ